ncbi:MAG: DegT/DnrJ/EryC1/StrS family aminotransferase [Algibacter sp.]|uniref:DegT/DnrJ/EryC1/StrS family aminotransferase n=1 Tax=Algibacter sp. TaxID=1872428 RepID=UPI002635E735|nr:DegT/DnrJ/EryC1/StrS family aminotransferase [Algibacter sp.]MDG1730031.1 DegT/DnrJ/EryC1/StrS family aminotransferase [Algibacter sp.]MDG2178346.1 DegT/DnrJ/EryC1/StrS family aminotransferase [Algibacter sp.]
MIKFLDLHKVNERFQEAFQKQFQLFLNSGNYILGEQVSKFESEFANYCGVKYCIAVSNGLDALKLIFEAYKVLGKLKEGDEILVPANTYIASVLALSHCRLKPVLIEPALDSFNIDPNELEKHITSKTKAILGVHLYGKLFDVNRLKLFCEKHNLLLVEDAAQAHGAKHLDGRKAGNLSHAAAFSFYPTKNLGGLGDGGAVTTNDYELETVIRQLRNYGRISTNENEYKGYNCRLDELQASFLRLKLKYLDQDNKKQQSIAQFYLNNIELKGVILPACENIESHVFHQFVIRHKKRNELKEYLKNNSVETLIHYPIPIHKQKAYRELNHLSFSVTEKIHSEILSLPIYATLGENEIREIVSVINTFN